MARDVRSALLLGCALLAACGERLGEEKTGRGLVVVVVDALRADHLGACGYDRPTTPYLDALAAEGTFFGFAYSPSPEMVPAHAAILTGCDPMLSRRIPISEPSRGTPVSDWYVPDALPRLARELLGRGFATAAFTDDPAIDPVCGFGAGFQEFSGFLSDRAPDAEDAGSAAVTTKCLNWLSGLDRSQSWFAYLQIDDLERQWTRADESRDSFFEPRAELSSVPPVSVAGRAFFAVPNPRWTGAARTVGQYEARYDGEIQKVDRNLGRFFAGLRRIGRWRETTVVVLGAYGVGFGESGLIADSGTFSDCDLHVPVIVRPDASVESRTKGRTRELFSLVDLAPTLLDLAGIPVPSGMRGVSHADAVRGKPGGADEIAFAAGGVQGGFVAIDARYCWEESSPGSLEQEPVSALSTSWYGDDLDHRKDVRRFLHDRKSNPSVGHLRGSADDAAASARLSAAAREHYEWIEKARAVLQGGSSALAGVDPATIAELRRRHLLGEERGAD
jgi:arylsulfatase A-like enzyme